MSRTVAAIVTELASVEDEVRWASLASAPRADAGRLGRLTARQDALVQELRSIDVSIDLSAAPALS